MKLPIAVVILFLSTLSVKAQTFLDAYKKYRLEKIDALPNSKTRKKIKSYIKSHIVELDTVFQSYKARTNFDFNNADTIFLIYDSPAESPFTSDIIIWSGKDTISYRQGFETIEPFKRKRIITYESFISRVDSPKGFKVVTERDSLITLVSRRDFDTINHLGDNQSINDGSYVSVYVSYKGKGKYKIESCFPHQFFINTRFQKE